MRIHDKLLSFVKAGLCCLMLLLCLFGKEVRSETMATLDRRAKNAPESVAQTPEELVAYLTQGITDNTQKARVLAVWVAYQVERNGYRRKQLMQYSGQNKQAPEALENDVFRTRIGTPQEFAELYQNLATLAGLEVVIIQGFAGYHIPAFRFEEPKYQAAEVIIRHYINDANYPLQRYRAAWNAVRINDEWHLVDTYWMISGDKLFAATTIQNDRAMKLFLEQRARRTPSRATLTANKRIDNHYFFAKPAQFIKTHFPLDSAWQLLPLPVSWSSFTQN